MCSRMAKVSKAAEETVVKRGGYCRVGRWRVESEEETQIHQRDVFIKALIDGERSQY